MEVQVVDLIYVLVYCVNGELNFLFNQLKKVVENFNKYFQLNDDLEVCYCYIIVLFVGKNYCEVILQVMQMEVGGFFNFYMKCMFVYFIYECNNVGVKSVDEYNKVLV